MLGLMRLIGGQQIPHFLQKNMRDLMGDHILYFSLRDGLADRQNECASAGGKNASIEAIVSMWVVCSQLLPVLLRNPNMNPSQSPMVKS